MSKITKISQQKRSSRVNVFIDDKFAFGISKKTMVDFDLHKDKVLSKKEIKEILEKDQMVKALEKSFRLLGIRPRSKKELEKKLQEKGFAKKIIKNTLKRLKELGYFDDKKFAQSWLEARKLAGKGKFIVKKELQEKGIEENLVKRILDKYSQKEEVEIARNLIERRRSKYQDLSSLEQKQKLARFLASRGFSWQTISKILKEFN